MVSEDEFAAAFEEYADAMFAHCYFRVSNRERALEITQDTFMKVWDFIQKGGTVKNMRAFLYTTLRRLIIDEYRKKKSDSLDAMLEAETVPTAISAALSTGSLAEEEYRIGASMDAKKLRETIVKLSTKDAELVTLRYIDNLSARAIGKILGINAAAANVRAHRALKKLKTLMKEVS